MKGLIQKRPLFLSILFSVAIAVICSFVGLIGILSLAASVLFLLLILLPLKTQYKKFIVVTCLLSLTVSLSNIFYYIFAYYPATKFVSATVEAECTVVSMKDSVCTLYCENTVDGEKMGFLTETDFDAADVDSVFPSAKLKVTLNFYLDKAYRNTSNGVHSYSEAADTVVLKEHNKWSPLYIYHAAREGVDSFLTIPDVEASAFLKGMMLGDRSEISGVFDNKFKTIGLSHVLSVSGLHLTLAVLLFDFLLAFFGVDYKLRSVISIITAFMFTAVSGFAVSCFRSFIMLAMYYVARIIDKFPDAVTSLAISAYAIICLSPYNILNISFVLSVLSTYGLIVLSPIFNSLIPITTKNRLLSFCLRFIRSAFTVCLAVTVLCMPVFVLYFKQISLVAPISNLILTVPIQIMFYLGFALLAFSKVSLFCGPLAFLASKLYSFISKIVDALYDLKYITVSDGNPFFYVVFLLLLVLTVGICIYSFRRKVKIIYPYILGYACLCLVFFGITYFTSKDKVSVNFASVGHGNAAIITCGEGAVIVDCGGEDITAVYDVLRRRNVKRIEALAITHIDSDHVNFLPNLIDTYEIDKIIYPEFLDEQKLKTLLVGTDLQSTELVSLSKDTAFDVLSDSKLYAYVEKAYESKITGNTSALYKFVFGKTSVCFSGDMGISQEYVYLDYGSELDCDILLVAHHGSPSSSLKRILEVYTPDYSIISASADRKYGLPDDRIIERLSGYSEVLYTYDYSNIRFVLSRKGYKPTFE